MTIQREYGVRTSRDAIALLMRVHYGFFMSNPHFWYDPDLVQADGITCRLASELRARASSGPVSAGRLRRNRIYNTT